MTALGLIETKGLVGAIEGADAMLKAANVRLLEKNCVGGGLVTITVAGEVAAVKASVEAAAAAIRRIDGAALVAEHVIARPDAELAKVIALQPAPCTAQEKTVPAASPATAPAPAQAPVVQVPAQAPVQPAHAAQAPKAAPVRHNAVQLKKMSLNKVRQIAQSISGLQLTRDEIAAASKNVLIEAIINVDRHREE